MKRIGVILSGCGVLDGSEIHESVLTLLAIDRAGAQAVCLAPDIPQTKVTDHQSKQEAAETRRVLAESARIARGEIRSLQEVRASELDAVILPGGYGAALNLSSFALAGPDCTVQSDVARLLREMYNQHKPIGALCIAPTVLAKAFQEMNVSLKLTIGRDRQTAAAIARMGHEHVDCAVHEVLVDEEHRILTSPAYMMARRISEVAEGVDKLVQEIVKRV
jgi:enhancing lycopene biosynthesis protein 2